MTMALLVPIEPLIMQKRGTAMPRLRMEALRKPVSRCNNSSPRRSVRTTMPLLLCRSFSGFHSQEISITLLFCLCLGKGFPIRVQRYEIFRNKISLTGKNQCFNTDF